MRTPPPVLPAHGHMGPEGPDAAVPFEGFDPPESNFWRLPNSWFDVVTHFTSWAEHKVVEYILRHTWGYQEYGIGKLITMDEFMHGRKRRDGSRLDAGCGMAENSIKKGIADAVSHGFLTVQTDDSDRGRIKKYYAPRMRQPQEDEGEHARPPLSPHPVGVGGTARPIFPSQQSTGGAPRMHARTAPAPAPAAHDHRANDARGQHVQAGGQALIGEGQTLTPDPQALIPGSPTQPLEPQGLTLRDQSRILSLPDADPRTEQIPLVKHQREDTRGQQQRAAATTPLMMTGTTGPQRTADAPSLHDRTPRGPAGAGRSAHPEPRGLSAQKEGITPPATRAGATARLEVENAPLVAPSEPLLGRLLAVGVGSAKARTLLANYPPAKIERQLAWLDSRRCQNRVGTLITAIERDYGPPPTLNSGSADAPAFDSAKFYCGAYAVCPACGCRPCAQGCAGGTANSAPYAE